mgnify:CR=1 FL=1
MDSKEKASWNIDCCQYLGADIYQTRFPSLYGTNIAISKFSPTTILDSNKILDEIFHSRLLKIEDCFSGERMFIYPSSKVNTKLSLSCCFEGDGVDWDANSAFFNNGKLVAIVSLGEDRENKILNELVKAGDLKKIYQQEIRNIAKSKLSYEGKGDPFNEFISILKAESPSGQGLHDIYRNAIRDIL